MKRYCRKCGAEMGENARFCGRCGASVDGTPEPEPNGQTPEKGGKMKYILITSLVILIVIVAAGTQIFLSFTGYRGLLRKTMKAVKNYDIDTLVEESSDIYFAMDDDDYLEKKYENQVGNYIDIFEDTVGHNYKFSYETNEIYIASDRTMDNAISSIENRYPDLDTDFIEKIAIADVTISATQGKKTKKMDIEVYMSREDGREWKLLWFTE